MFAKPLFAAAIAAVAMLGTAAVASGPIVSTGSGKVEGRAEAGLNMFFGIPYGADTGGRNRFLPPRPATAWKGVLQATAMGPRCPQPERKSPTRLIVASDAPVSEDCLKLNIWAPATGKNKRPVMLWLHGGAYGFGSANDPFYDGASLARNEGVVVVSINHRLNGFGYLYLGPEAGPAFAGAANLGQQDIVEALRWVKANIARFGGDPGNVTVFGQSGGGGKISNLLAMPSARGLFHKAIIESGSILTTDDETRALAQRDKVLAALNLKPAEVGKLRDLPMADLIAAFEKAGPLDYNPWVDGTVLPRDPFAPDASPLARDIPLLIGTAHDEATAIAAMSPMWLSMTDDMLRMMIAPLVGPQRVDRAISLYRARTPNQSAPQLYAAVLTDAKFGHNAAVLASRKAVQGGAPAYLFRTDWKSPALGGVLGAPHGVELSFVFGTDKMPGLVGDAPQPAMVALFQKSFAAFARTGRPDAPAYPAWPAYTPEDRQVFIYDNQPRVLSDPDGDLRRFWDEVSGESSEPTRK